MKGSIENKAFAKSKGEKIKYARERFGLSITGLSEATGVSQPYISQIEAGQKTPSNRILMSIAKALNIPGEFLLRDDIKTLEQYEAAESIAHKLDSRFLNYAVVINKAVEANITPEEIDEVLTIIKKHKSHQS